MSKILIGIDPGVNTGIAVSKDGKLEEVVTEQLHEAFKMIDCFIWNKKPEDTLIIYVEDARKRKYYGANSAAKQQGAGSIKRDCRAWEDYLSSHQVDFVLVDPKDQKGLTKWDAKTFKQKTGWQERTNEHGRDAALLIWGR